MKRFAVWLWKEWRDQRAVTVGILVAIPGLTALAYWAFGERIGQAHLDNVRPVFLGIAVGLVVFAVAGDLLAGENRRKTIRAVRRLPGSLGSAFAAKLTFLGLLIVAVIALQGVSLAVAENLNAERMAEIGMSGYHLNGASRSMALFEELGQFPGSTLWFTGLGFGVLALWTLLVSSWMGRSGVAGIGAIVLLAALATPFVLFFKDHPWFFPGPMRLAALTATLAALVALVATALSFLRGQRFHGRPFRPFLLGAAVLGVCLGGGYAYAQHSLDAWLEIEPTDEDFRIWEAKVGAGDRYLYLTVHRGAAWNGGKTMYGRHDGLRDPWAERRGSPMQAWVVDLTTGKRAIVDDRAERYFDRVPEAAGVILPMPLDPVEALVSYSLNGEEIAGLGWWDARTGERVRVLSSKVRDGVTLELARRQLRADTWQRDAQGRRVWLRDDLLEREDDSVELPKALVPRHTRTRALQPVPGGWFGFRWGKTGTIDSLLFLDAATGEEQSIDRKKHSILYMDVLSPTHMFTHEGNRKLLLAFEDPEHLIAPKNPPRSISNIVGRDQVLAVRGAKHAGSLHVWNPLTGEDRPLRWQGAAPEGISEVAARGRTSDGRILLRVVAQRPRARFAWAVLDADHASVQLVKPYSRNQHQYPVALLQNDALVMLEDRRTVVRYRPRGGSEVLFPRP